MEWLRLLIEFLTVLIVNGAFFYTINRKIKKLEVKEKEIDIVKKQDDEWQELYLEAKEQKKELEEKCEKLVAENSELQRLKGLTDFENHKLSWYKCITQDCPNRKPPHAYDVEGKDLGPIND